MKTGTLIFIFALMTRAAFGAAVPTITGVVPNSGTINGGTTVTISGSNFNNGAATGVTVGGSAATFNVIDDATISAVVPAHIAGNVTVSVTNGAGTGTSTLANGYTYTTANGNLQVTVTLTIPKRADIQWGNGTTVDDNGLDHTLPANRITAYNWTVSDPAYGTSLSPATVYTTNDSANNKTLMLSNVSKTNSVLTVTGITSNTTYWNAGGAPGSSIFRMRAQLGAGALTTLSSTPATLGASLAIGADQPLVLEFDTPTQVTSASVGVSQVIAVTLTATPN